MDGTVIEPSGGYTNQIPLSTDSSGNPYNNGQGWKADTRLSASSGYAEVGSSGTDITGYIPVKPGDVIRMKNIMIPYANTSGYSNVAYAFNSDKTGLNAVQLCSNASSSFKISTDDNGNVIQFTVDSTFIGGNAGYIRINAAEITSESVITVNEEIE